MERKPEPISAAEDAPRAALHERRYRCCICDRGHDTPDCEACGPTLGQWRNPEAPPDAFTGSQIVAQIRVARGQKPLQALLQAELGGGLGPGLAQAAAQNGFFAQVNTLTDTEAPQIRVRPVSGEVRLKPGVVTWVAGSQDQAESIILKLEADLALERAAVLAKDKELAELRQRVAERDASALHAIRRTAR